MSPASVLLLLVGLCAATEYYVKPTIPQETSCPRESCYTLDELAAKYLYASAVDVLTDNVTVIFLDGTHKLKGSVFVREVNDFTLLGAGGTNGESHVEINCKGRSSLFFDGIINLTITRITFSQCGALHEYVDLNFLQLESNIYALIFSDVFNLRLTWVVVKNSTSSAGILAVNVFGASVIDHSVFQGFGLPGNFDYNSLLNHINIWYENCNMTHYHSHRCSNKTESLLHAVSSHKLHIHNCVLRDGTSGSIGIILYHVGYNVELDLMNITALNGGGVGQEGDIYIDTGSVANYIVTLRDSYIGNCEAAAIYVASRRPEANLSRLIHIINSTIDKCATGVQIDYSSSPTITIPQIIIESCIIMNIGAGGYMHQPGLKIASDDAERTQPSLASELINCTFVGNQGTPIALHDSVIKGSDTLSFVNNTAYEGGAMAFYGKSYMSVSLEKNTQLLFTNNYAEHVGGAIFAEEMEYQGTCFLHLETHNSKCSDLRNNHQLSLIFTNNTAHNGGDAIYGGSLYHCNIGVCKVRNVISIPIVGLSLTTGILFNTTQDITQTFPSYLPHRLVSVCERMENLTV